MYNQLQINDKMRKRYAHTHTNTEGKKERERERTDKFLTVMVVSG